NVMAGASNSPDSSKHESVFRCEAGAICKSGRVERGYVEAGSAFEDKVGYDPTHCWGMHNAVAAEAGRHDHFPDEAENGFAVGRDGVGSRPPADLGPAFENLRAAHSAFPGHAFEGGWFEGGLLLKSADSRC